MTKLQFTGIIYSVQPRIKLVRSFDESSHIYLGYVLLIEGIMDGVKRELSVGIGKASQQKYQFCIGDDISGECVPVADERLEPCEFYKATKLTKIGHTSESTVVSPPWEDIPTVLEVYRERGHRRLATRTYDTKCITCKWGCRMPVEIIIDNWNPSKSEYRYETFCYGPLNCKLYKAGPTRKVEGRKGMVYEEGDYVDEEATRHRESHE